MEKTMDLYGRYILGAVMGFLVAVLVFAGKIVS